MKTTLQKIGILIAVLLGSLSAYAYDFEVDGIYYNVISIEDLTCSVTSGDKKYSGEVIIPSEVTYKNRNFQVTSIGSSSFMCCSSLTNIVIGKNVTTIGEDAFYECRALTSIVIPNNVTTIDRGAFIRCSSLKEIIISNSLEIIKDACFFWCSSLQKILIPNSVVKIEKSAFEGCEALESIELSEQLKSIEESAFRQCESLSSISIPGSVETIDWGKGSSSMFYLCKSLNEMQFLYGDSPLKVNNLCSGYTIPLEIVRLCIDREIIWGTQSDVPYLKELTFGSHLSKCTKDFSAIDSLETVTCHAVIPPTVKGFSNAQYMNLNVRVPKESIEAYKQADVWKNFWNLEGFEEDGVEDVKIDSKKEVIGRYDPNGRAVSEDYQGLMIVRFSDGSCKKVINR